MIKTILLLILGVAIVASQRNNCVETQTAGVLVDSKDATL